MSKKFSSNEFHSWVVFSKEGKYKSSGTGQSLDSILSAFYICKAAADEGDIFVRCQLKPDADTVTHREILK